jgi:hypothetical protein
MTSYGRQYEGHFQCIICLRKDNLNLTIPSSSWNLILLHIGAKMLFSFIYINKFDNSARSAVHIIFFLLCQLNNYIILTRKMAAEIEKYLQRIKNIFEPCHDKTNIMRLRPAWIQTSLRIRAVWSGSMLFAYKLYNK